MQPDFYYLDLLFLFYYYHHYFSIDYTGKLQEICEKCTLVNFKFGQTCEWQSRNIILASTSGANLTGGEPTRNNLFCKQTFQTTIGKDNTYTIPIVLHSTSHTHLMNNRTNNDKLVKKLWLGNCYDFSLICHMFYIEHDNVCKGKRIERVYKI